MSTHEATTPADDGDREATRTATQTTDTEGTAGAPSRSGDELTPGPATEFTRDTVLEMFSNQRRRFAIHYLKRRPDHEAPLCDLAERVACWQTGSDTEELSYADKKSVQNALRQFHLPKLAEAGFVEYDEALGTVRLTDAASEQRFYIDVVPSQRVPAGAYWLAVGGASTLTTGGLWLDVAPFGAAGPALWLGLLAAALLGSAAVYVYDNCYRVRLGASPTPAEVRDDR
jgi:hypothetical protein